MTARGSDDVSARRVGVRRVAVAAHLIAAVAPSAVQAETTAPALVVTWSGLDGCPQPSEVVGEIDRLLGGIPPGPTRMTSRARVRRRGDEHIAEVDIVADGRTGTRIIRGASCEEVAAATALIVALAFDPDAVSTAEATAPSPPVPPRAPTIPSPPAPRLLRTRPAPPPPRLPPTEPNVPPPVAFSRPAIWWWGVSAGAVVDVGTLPAAAVGVEARLVGRHNRWSARLGGRYFPGADETLEARAAGGSFSTWSLSGGGCFAVWRLRDVPWRTAGNAILDACLLFEGGRIEGRGFGVSSPGRGSDVWLAPRAEGSLEVVAFRFLSGAVDLGLGVPAHRPEFVLQSVGVVHRPDPIFARAGVRAVAVF